MKIFFTAVAANDTCVGQECIYEGEESNSEIGAEAYERRLWTIQFIRFWNTSQFIKG